MPKCKVSGCDNDANYEVILYDFYPHNGSVFFEQDYTCPFICVDHTIENEKGISGTRQPRSRPAYPFTNKDNAQGFTIYRPISKIEKI